MRHEDIVTEVMAAKNAKLYKRRTRRAVAQTPRTRPQKWTIKPEAEQQGIGALNWVILAVCAAIIVVGIKIGLAWVV